MIQLPDEPPIRSVWINEPKECTNIFLLIAVIIVSLLPVVIMLIQ